MRNKYIAWSLVLTMLISNLFLIGESPAPVSAAGGPNLALGKNVSASSYTQTYGPGNVNDSNQGTYWESNNNAFPQWIQVDLGSNTNIDQIVLKLPASWGTRTQTLAVQGSTNGSTFNNIVGSANYAFDPSVAGNSVTINFAAVSTRYVRLNITANTEWPAGQLSEFEIYGAGGTTPTPTPTPAPTTAPTPTPAPTATPAPTPPVNSNRGASMPYTRYDTDDATRGGGATLKSAPNFDQSQTASEASGQRYIALPSNGSNVQWTVRPGEGGAGVTMRFTMPDSANGMGLNGALDVYVNGTKAKTVPLTSYYNWQYFSSDHPGDTPADGRPLFRFDEVHWKLDTPLKAGDTIRIQKNNGDSLEYGVDFLEIEPVPAAITRPANSVSVTDFGAVANDGGDDIAAFEAAVQSAVSTGKTLYIPEGTFHLSRMWKIGTETNMINNITILGAGIWHTNIQFTNPNVAGGGISFRVQGKLDFSNVYMNSNLRSRYGEQAIYKAFMDNFGKNSRVSNVWVEHFECGIWVGDYAHTPAMIADGLVIENSRIRNNLADGVNFAQGTSNSTVRNSSIRNNGDDGLAVWTSSVNGAPQGVNNTFSFNTIEHNWRAAGIAFFGGSGHKATNNLIVDTVGGSGIRMNTVFPGYHFQNNSGITFSDTTIINSGTSKDLYNGERGAIDLEASSDSIRNVTFTNIDIINTQRSAVQFGYGGGFQNIVFNNININGTGRDGIETSRFTSPHKGAAIYTYTGNGSATFNNLTTSNIANPNVNFIQNGFNLNIQ